MSDQTKRTQFSFSRSLRIWFSRLIPCELHEIEQIEILHQQQIGGESL
jgi:hypothetical protein